MCEPQERLEASSAQERSALSAGVNAAIGRAFNLEYYEPNTVLGGCWHATRVSDGLKVLIKPLPAKRLRRRSSLWASRGSPASFGIERLETHVSVLTPIWTFATKAYGELGVFDVADPNVCTLETYLCNVRNELDERLILSIFVRIAMAVDFLHRHGGDGDRRYVSTATVLMDPRRGVVLAGYKEATDGAMSPLIDGPPLSSVEEEKDIWLLGTVLYQLLTHKRFPCDGTCNALATVDDVMDDVPAHVSADLRSLLHNLLRRDEARTFQRIGDVLATPLMAAASEQAKRDFRRTTTVLSRDATAQSPDAAKRNSLFRGQSDVFWLQG
jgi:hypothetical protein